MTTTSWRSSVRVPGEAQRRRLQDRLAAELGMDLVDVRFVRSARLERLPFTMFWADLRRTGRVLWGDPDILGRLPAYNLAACRSSRDASSCSTG